MRYFFQTSTHHINRKEFLFYYYFWRAPKGYWRIYGSLFRGTSCFFFKIFVQLFPGERRECLMSPKYNQDRIYVCMINLRSLSMHLYKPSITRLKGEASGQLVAVNLSNSVTHSSQIHLQKAQEQTLPCVKH